MRKAILPVLFLTACTPAFAAADALDWLAGHWCGSQGGVFREETWLAPRAGTLIGMHRDSRDGKLAGFEYFRIVEDGNALVYWTQPNGRPATAFRARTAGKDRIEFTNPAHDFPKRISYHRMDAATLHARIDDGTDRGRHMQWSWQRDCPGR